jgi:putative FmdB family regulatory protein
MPIYEYRCQSCGKKFEVLQKFSDPPVTVHEECGGNVEKLISTSALQFKGSGWYVNDYAKGGTSKPAETKTESKSDGGGEKKSDTKTESKPAATESKPAPSTSSPTDSK